MTAELFLEKVGTIYNGVFDKNFYLGAFDVTNNGRHFWFLPRIRNLVKNARNGIFFVLYMKKHK